MGWMWPRAVEARADAPGPRRSRTGVGASTAMFPDPSAVTRLVGFGVTAVCFPVTCFDVRYRALSRSAMVWA
jgi:hypothetical protein